MVRRRAASHVAILLLVVLACGGHPALSAQAANSARMLARDDVTAAPPAMPAPVWQGIRRVRILCLINSDRGVVTGELHDRLCTRARDLVASGAPVPVQVAQPGAPEIMQADSLTILVHVSITGTGEDRLAALAIRPWRNDPASGMLFAAAPHAVRLGSDPLAALEPALRSAIAETVPWAARVQGDRRLN